MGVPKPIDSSQRSLGVSPCEHSSDLLHAIRRPITLTIFSMRALASILHSASSKRRHLVTACQLAVRSKCSPLTNQRNINFAPTEKVSQPDGFKQYHKIAADMYNMQRLRK